MNSSSGKGNVGDTVSSNRAGSIFRVVIVCLQSHGLLFNKFQVQCQSSWTDEVVHAQRLPSAIATTR